MNAEIKIIPLDNNWVEGNFGPYRFQAKIFVEPSQFGINAGRVSKLWVRGHQPETFINFDRGWDAGVDVESVWKPLVEELERFAQTDEFKNSIMEVRP